MHEEKVMAGPTWKWEWNLNTIFVLCGFAGGLVAWGYTFSNIQTGWATADRDITALSVRVTANELSLRRVDTHELRLTSIEKNANDASLAMKSLDMTLNGLASDMKVTREILQRIEAAQREQFRKP